MARGQSDEAMGTSNDGNGNGSGPQGNGQQAIEE